MTRECIEDMREVVLSFVKKMLLENNYENLGESDAEEFAMEFNEILDLAIKALEQEPITKNDLGVDCISRKQVLYWLENATDDSIENALNNNLDFISSVTPQSRWIPVSERLPKAEYGESDSVLVCFENGTQDVLYFDGSNWRYPTGESYISVNHKNGWHNKVIAWMPLPQSYSEVEE